MKNQTCNSSPIAVDEKAIATPMLWRRPLVEGETGLSRSGIYALMAAGMFPKPVRLSAKAVAWRRADVLAWINSREVAHA